MIASHHTPSIHQFSIFALHFDLKSPENHKSHFSLRPRDSLVDPGNGFPLPLQLESRVGAHADGGGLGGADGLPYGLVQLLRVEHQHVHGLDVLLRLHVLAHHRRLDRGQDAELGAQRRDLFANLERKGKVFPFAASKKERHVRALTVKRLVLIFLSVQCLPYSLASSVMRSETSANPLAQASSSLLVPRPGWTSSERWAMRNAIFLAAAMISLSV